MLKSKLIIQLQHIPGDPEVCIFDYLRNIQESDEDGSSAGIYEKFDVELMKDDNPETNPDSLKPWISLSFKNKFIELEDEELSKTAIPSFLTERDIKVIKLICEEKNVKEIAGSLGIGLRSGDRVRRELLKKCGVSSVVGLVKYAIRKKIVNPF